MRSRLKKFTDSFLLGSIVVTLTGFSTWVLAKDTAEEYEDEFAYRTVLETINLENSLSKKADVRPEHLITLGMATEVAMILLERSSTRDALRWLAELSLVRLDGSVAESHTCAVLSKGTRILPYLQRSRTRVGKEPCIPSEKTVNASAENVCAPTEDAIRRIDILTRAVRKGEKCD